MKSVLIAFLLSAGLALNAQNKPVTLPSSATQIVVDSKDNLIVHCFRGRMLKISPDGASTVITDDLQKGYSRNPWPKCEVMTIDAQDNVYFSDGNLIWKMTPDNKISWYPGIPYTAKRADGDSTLASFRSIAYMKTDKEGNIIVVEKDDKNEGDLGYYYVIRKIDRNRKLTTITDTRNNAALKTKWIAGIGLDSIGNIYLSDGYGRCIKKLEKDGKVTTLAGLCYKREFSPLYIQGDIAKAELMSPEDIVINKKGDVIFADLRLNRIIKIADKKVTTIAGNSVIQPNNVNMGGRSKEGYKDGKALTALFGFPSKVAIAIDSKGNIYILDGGNDCIRKLSVEGVVSTVARRG